MYSYDIRDLVLAMRNAANQAQFYQQERALYATQVDSICSAQMYRQLPCRTFLSCGTCPYRDRCVYLHDPRLSCSSSKIKSRVGGLDSIANNFF